VSPQDKRITLIGYQSKQQFGKTAVKNTKKKKKKKTRRKSEKE